MDKKLLLSAAVKLLGGMAAIALLLFPAAGSFSYWNAWLLMGLLFVPMTIMGAALLFKAPELLKKRLSTRETESEQRAVVALSAAQFVVGFVLAGLDYRFGWSHLPPWVVIAACCIFLAGYALFALVTRENAYLSRTVEVQQNQKVVYTGPYALVRHPMYLATVLMFLAMPLVLGSGWAFLVFLPYPLILVRRITNEEEVLEKGLAGYAQYIERVKYRLIPFIW